MGLNLELEQARAAATTLGDLQHQAAKLPILEKQAAQQQRIENAMTRLDQAVAVHRAAVRESRVKMADYRKRLKPILAELGALAGILAEVGDLMHDAQARVGHFCYELSAARAVEPEDYAQAKASAQGAEVIMDTLALEETTGLGPWSRDASLNAVIKVIVEKAAARGGKVYDPAYGLQF